MRRQEFERRRKELAEQQPKLSRPRQRRTVKHDPNTGLPIVADATERVPKKRQRKLQTTTPVGGSGTAVGQQGPCSTSLSPGDKGPDRVPPGVDYTLMAEQLLHQLHELSPVLLQEPDVKINYAVWPMLGTSVFSGWFFVFVSEIG